MAVPSDSAASTQAAAAVPADVQATLTRAGTGAMPLAELLDAAQQLNQRGLAEASAHLYESWIDATESPLRHVACFNWGTVLGALGRTQDAVTAYRRSLSYKPDFGQARVNLGHQLEHLDRPEEALSEWQQVRDTSGDDDESLPLKLHALNNRARLLEKLRRYEEAESEMRASLLLDADQVDVIQHYVHIRQKQCRWPLYEPFGNVTHNKLLVGTSALAMLSASDDPAMQLLAAKRFVYEKVPKPPAGAFYKRVARPAGAKLRVGYLSGDLSLHAVGLLMPELLELHDRNRVEVYGLCWSREDGTAQRARLRKAMDYYVPLAGVDDTVAAQRIASLGIDVLVDLQGLTSGARPAILGMRPAPVQIGYLGLPGTSALPGVDYMIADRYVMPEALLPYCIEQPVYMPHCYQVSDRRRDIGPTPTRAEHKLPEDAFVYCSFNNNFKFTEDVFPLWMRVLAQVPGSVLWLLADNDWSRENMLRMADAHGVARERLIFAGRVSPADYLARFQLADLFLDTYPYNAGTTASDALWMGTPLLTCSGRTYISRMAGSLLTHIGLPDLITETLGDYEARAVQLGRQPARVASYKRYLAEHGRTSPLFDIPQFVRDLEAQYDELLARVAPARHKAMKASAT